MQSVNTAQQLIKQQQLQKQNQAKLQQVPDINRLLLFPTRTIPQSLKKLQQLILNKKDIQVRFINGYRNVLLVKDNNAMQWGIKTNENHCGFVFCYLLKPTLKESQITAVIALFKESNEYYINKANSSMYVVESKGTDIAQQENTEKIKSFKLTESNFDQLVTDVQQSGKNQKIALNLIKNAFSSYQSYKTIVQNFVVKRQQILLKQQSNIPLVTESLNTELLIKKLQKNQIRNVPKYDMKTGNLIPNENIEITV